MNFTVNRLLLPLTLCLLASAALAAPAQAACSYPRAPDAMPDGETATKEQMLAGKKEVTRYNDDMTAYLNCITLESKGTLDQMDKDGGDLKSDEEKKALQARKDEYQRKHTERHNAAVDEVTAVVERFNEQLRAYKKKQSGG